LWVFWRRVYSAHLKTHYFCFIGWLCRCLFSATYSVQLYACVIGVHSFIVLLLESCADDDMTFRVLRPHPPLVIRQTVCADACLAPDIQFSRMHVLLAFSFIVILDGCGDACLAPHMCFWRSQLYCTFTGWLWRCLFSTRHSALCMCYWRSALLYFYWIAVQMTT
jgi:hypothetical protein